MDPTPEGQPPAELAPAGAPRHPARAAVASLTVIALLAAAVGVVAATRHHANPRLVLSPGSQVPEQARAAPTVVGGGLGPYRYRLGIPAPDLGSDAAVARLEAPAVDAARVASLAKALGLSGAATPMPGGSGWQVTDRSAELLVAPTPGGWTVSYAPNSVDSAPGSVPGSTGSGRAPNAGSAGGGQTSSNPSGATAVPPVPLQPVAPPTAPVPPGPVPTVPTTPVPAPVPTIPANLPDAARAEQIARGLLDRMGISGDWSVTVDTTSGGSAVMCAPAPCPGPLPIVPSTLTVELHPRLAGIAIDSLSWRVEIGDQGRIVGVGGTWTDLRTLGRYPLRTVDAVFADLAAGRGIDPLPEPVAATEPGGAVPFHEIAPVTVTIDHVTLGLAVMPAFDNAGAVVDVVPTYVFSGHTADGQQISRSLVAVEASVTTPSTAPGATKPGAGPTVVAPPMT
jgi:hypothetical protein